MYLGETMIAFQTSVHIARPIDGVFAFVADPLQLPRWNSAVQSVHNTSGRPGTIGSSYAMRRQLPTGRADNQLEIFDLQPATTFAIRTLTGPTPFVYRYRFIEDGGGTVVELDATVELTGAAALVPALPARAIKRGVDANLATLKHTLEQDDAMPVAGARS
jgi:uncharacterized protein YndB with AHSA1/START domain